MNTNYGMKSSAKWHVTDGVLTYGVFDTLKAASNKAAELEKEEGREFWVVKYKNSEWLLRNAEQI